MAARALTAVDPDAQATDLPQTTFRSRVFALTSAELPLPDPRWKCIGQRVADGVWIAWEVSGTPSPTGADAPVPVVAATVSASQQM